MRVSEQGHHLHHRLPPRTQRPPNQPQRVDSTRAPARRAEAERARGSRPRQPADAGSRRRWRKVVVGTGVAGVEALPQLSVLLQHLRVAAGERQTLPKHGTGFSDVEGGKRGEMPASALGIVLR